MLEYVVKNSVLKQGCSHIVCGLSAMDLSKGVAPATTNLVVHQSGYFFSQFAVLVQGKSDKKPVTLVMYRNDSLCI